MENKKAFSLNSARGKTYIIGIEENSSWEKKLLKAGCEKTTKGDLKIPDDALPLVFLEETLSKEKIDKYGGIDFIKPKKAPELEKEDRNSTLKVFTDKETKNIIVSGLSKKDKNAHSFIKSFRGEFNRSKEVWVVPNKDQNLKQNEFYKAVKSALSVKRGLSQKDKEPASNFKLTVFGNNILVSNPELKDSKELMKKFKSFINEKNLFIGWNRNEKQLEVANVNKETFSDLLSEFEENISSEKDSINKILEEFKKGNLDINDAAADLRKQLSNSTTQTVDLS